MAANKFDDLSSINQSRRDWKIKVKVVRFWRGATKEGQFFSNFNILLMDKQETKIPGFVPAKCNDALELKLALGNICSITNFDVELFKPDDKFRCSLNNYRLVFAEDTKVKQLEDKDSKFPADTFDFYNHADLKSITGINVYLTDVIGIVCNRDKINLSEVHNRLGLKQTQLKFTITDGSSKVNVTFWDGMAKKLFYDIERTEEDPIIIILAAAKIGLWNSEVDVSHVDATHFYLNHDHHSVKQIRKRLQDPNFSQKVTTLKQNKPLKLLQISAILSLGLDYVKSEVLTHATIKYVDDNDIWFINVCTKCKKEILAQNEVFKCHLCERTIPLPEKRYKLAVVVTDNSGGIEILINDRQVRSLVRIRAQQLYDELKGKSSFPASLKVLQRRDITAKILITEGNVAGNDKIYIATNVCSGFHTPQGSKAQLQVQNNMSEASSSNLHLDEISQLNVDSES